MMYVDHKHDQAQLNDYDNKIKEDVIDSFFKINEAVVNHKKQLHHDQNKDG